MKCEDIHNNVLFLLDQATNEQLQAINAHISECKSCKAIVDGLQQENQYIQLQKNKKAKSNTADLVLHTINTQEKPKSVWLGWNKAVLAAAMLTGLYLGLNIGSFTQTDYTVSTTELNSELAYFDDFMQESIEYNLINEEQ